MKTQQTIGAFWEVQLSNQEKSVAAIFLFQLSSLTVGVLTKFETKMSLSIREIIKLSLRSIYLLLSTIYWGWLSSL